MTHLIHRPEDSLRRRKTYRLMMTPASAGKDDHDAPPPESLLDSVAAAAWLGATDGPR